MIKDFFKRMKTKYVPVGGGPVFTYREFFHWFKPESKFYYPFYLETITTLQQQKDFDRDFLGKDTFFITDSGGFQVIRDPNVNLSEYSSLTEQIRTRSDLIFSFDIPPVKRTSEEQNQFVAVDEKQYYELLEKNWKTAVWQMDKMKEIGEDPSKKLCFVFHAKDKKSIEFNLKMIEEEMGFDRFYSNFKGVSFAPKKDRTFLSLIGAYAEKYFGHMHTHFLGIGTFKSIPFLVRAGVDTFDASSTMRASINREIFIPFGRGKKTLHGQLGSYKTHFPCSCPICSNDDWISNQNITEKKQQVYSNAFLHNLYKLVEFNYFVDLTYQQNPDFFMETIPYICVYNEKDKKALNLLDLLLKDGIDEVYAKNRRFFDESVNGVQRSIFGSFK